MRHGKVLGRQQNVRATEVGELKPPGCASRYHADRRVSGGEEAEAQTVEANINHQQGGDHATTVSLRGLAGHEAAVLLRRVRCRMGEICGAVVGNGYCTSATPGWYLDHNRGDRRKTRRLAGAFLPKA